jgi:hypothetical protein
MTALPRVRPLVLRKLLVLSCISFGLAACVSAEERRQADATACQRDGFAQGTPEFANCMQRRQVVRDWPHFQTLDYRGN